MAYTIDMYFLFSSGKGETEKEDEEWHQHPYQEHNPGRALSLSFVHEALLFLLNNVVFCCIKIK